MYNFNELAELSGESIQTLNNWHKHRPRAFELLLRGAINKRIDALFAASPLDPPPDIEMHIWEVNTDVISSEVAVTVKNKPRHL